MKQIKQFLIGTFFTSLIAAHCVAQPDSGKTTIEGSWQVTSIDGQDTITQDIWLFQDNVFYQSVANQTLPEENFEQQGQNIRLEQADFEILQQSEKHMTVKVERYTFQLKKIDALTHAYASTGCY